MIWQKLRKKNNDHRRDYNENKTLNVTNNGRDSDERDIASSNPKADKIKIITDEPTLEDALDFDSYSKQLADIIRNSIPRFAIGVFGGWGTGKTSLMKMIEESLLKGNYVFNWQRVPAYNDDKMLLKTYLRNNFRNLDWIDKKDFVWDEKTIEMYDDANNDSLSISIDKKKTNYASVSINGKQFNNEFIVDKKGDVYKREKDILTVWFNAWKYEKENYLAVVPFLRTIKITLDNDKGSKSGKGWDNIRDALENTFRAFTESTNISLGLGNYGSTQIDLSKFTDVLRANGSAKMDGENIYFHKHVTDYLEDSLFKLRDKNSNHRIVVFIDDLDRCHPKQALDVLDSIKTFFDIEGIVYVIGMDVDSIDSIIEEKYGSADVKKGSDYLQKIVQLPFKIPEWKAKDISNSIDKIISEGLKGTYLVEEFNKNKSLIVKAVKHNPREVKRFINNVILAKSVLSDEEHIDKLLAYQALIYRREWSRFLELIIPDEVRKGFLTQYATLKDNLKDVMNDDELNSLSKELSDSEQGLFKQNMPIYRELVKQGNDLMNFLDPHAIAILNDIEEMEKYRRAFDVTKIKPMQDELLQTTENMRPMENMKVMEEPPYVGPRPFQRTIYDQARFFGRDQEAEQIISLIKSNSVVLMYSKSGAGKTSLLNAKIIPMLENDGYEVLPSARVTNVFSVFPDDTSDGKNVYMLNAFQSLLGQQLYSPSLVNKKLTDFLNDSYPVSYDKTTGNSKPRLLIFNELEELFTSYHDKEREQQKDFFEQVGKAVKDSPILHIVFVIREEYLAELDPFLELLPGGLRARFRLEPLRRENALLAVTMPLKNAGISFKSFEAERLIDELMKVHVLSPDGTRSSQIKGEFVEPIFLQIVCQRLWNKLKMSPINQINWDYKDLGSIITALETIYAVAIDKAARRTGVSEYKIREWIGEKLITPMGTRGLILSGQQLADGIPNEVFDVLEKEYLIRVEYRMGAKWYELTHDRWIFPIIESNKKFRGTK